MVGREAAYHFETSVAGMMAVAAGVHFTLAVMLAPRHGYLSRRLFRLRMAFRIASEDAMALLFRWQERRDGDPMPLTQIREAIGGGWLPRLALRWSRCTGRANLMDKGLQLTKKGVRSGSVLIQRHRLWESWLSKHTTLATDHLHEPAHRMEHFIDDNIMENVITAVDHPEEDPHGRPIP